MNRHLRVLPGGKSQPPDRRRLALAVGLAFWAGFMIWAIPDIRHSPHPRLALYAALIFGLFVFGLGAAVVYLADRLTRSR